MKAKPGKHGTPRCSGCSASQLSGETTLARHMPTASMAK
jgi:hypothetical protein